VTWFTATLTLKRQLLTSSVPPITAIADLMGERINRKSKRRTKEEGGRIEAKVRERKIDNKKSKYEKVEATEDLTKHALNPFSDFNFKS
jgi:hypothetical protein